MTSSTSTRVCAAASTAPSAQASAPTSQVAMSRHPARQARAADFDSFARKRTGLSTGMLPSLLPKVATCAVHPATVCASETCVSRSAYPSSVCVRRGSCSSPICQACDIPRVCPSGSGHRSCGSPAAQSSLAILPDAIKSARRAAMQISCVGSHRCGRDDGWARYFFDQIAWAMARSGGYTVTGTPDCHWMMVSPASTRRPLPSNLIRPPG
jgi:hypothetical protein